MSYFSEALNDLMNQNNLRATDICSELHINKSYFSKMKNGTILPAQFGMIEGLAVSMRLGCADRERLYTTYKASKFGSFYPLIEKSVEHLFELDSLPEYEADQLENARKSFANGSLISGEIDVIQAIMHFFAGEHNEIDIILEPSDNGVSEAIEKGAVLKRGSVKINWLLRLSSSKMDGISSENIDAISHVVGILFSCNVNMHYQYINMNEHYLYSAFPFMLVSDNEVLLISQDCSEALYFSEPKTVNIYLEKFRFMFGRSDNFCDVYSDALDFLDGCGEFFGNDAASVKEENELYILRKHPCIIFGIDEDSLKKSVVNSDKKSQIISKYAKFLYSNAKNTRTEHIIFSEEGLREFFELDEFYEFNKQLTYPLSKETRKMCYARILEYAKEHSFIEHCMLRSTLLDRGDACMANIWTDGRMLFMFNFENGYRIM